MALTEVDLNVPQKGKNNKRLSVERIYQKKSQLEHILLRPDSYIGSVEPCQQNMWVFDSENECIVSKNITYSPGLYKIFDEIIVNAADNKQRDPRMNSIKVNIDAEKNVISIWNNGKGIPIEIHKKEKMYVPTMIFGHLLTSSNYDDTEKKVVGGRNGFGAKLCNIFSSKFTVETVTEGKKFKQVWRNNMSKAEVEKVVDCSGTDFTCITFSPDLPKFKMESLDDDFVALLKRRAYDIAGVSRGVTVTLNGDKLKIKTFKDYVGLYVKAAKLLRKNDDPDTPEPKIVHEIVNPRWEVCVTVSETGFQQSSFVNSIATTKGGTHMNYLVDQICEKLIAAVKKKTGKGGFNIKPFQVKSHLWVFANTLIENPTFDSQTKENMTLRKTSFGSTCELSEKYVKDVQNCGVLENIMSWVKFKSEAQLNKKTFTNKHSKLKGIPKLDDANNAGTKNSRECTLIVTEGDSAKALAMSGISVVGRDKYGVFPLKGKMLNVRDATHKQIVDNAEVGYLLKIIGLQFGKKYTEEDMKTLRYGHLMIMADQDIDGSHIKGLVINFIHAHWPSLLHLKFLEEFITPIVKVTKGNQSRSFFSLPEFEEWKKETSNYKSWRVKYYKGLGTSTSKEGKEYFSNIQRHRIVFKYDGPSSDQAIIMGFSKKMANERKAWLTTGMEERKLRREAGLPEMYLYEENTRSVTYQDFVNKELILFSNADNERSIPSLVDGLKPGQRKVLFTCMKRNDKNEVKVAQLAGSVSEQSAYHHGEASLMGTIVGMAQNHVGSNNLNLLVPHGQFGTRNLGGKDSASPRYIFTMMSSLTRMIFPTFDDHVLTFLFEDNKKIEPEWYCPIIPMCLVNGAEGIGTGWSTKVPNYDVRELVTHVKAHITGEDPPTVLLPSYKNFTGDIVPTDEHGYANYGVISVIDDTTVEITELPVKCWTQHYKESVMDFLLYGNDKVKPVITDYKEYHTDTTVKFVVTLTAEQLAQAEQEGLHKVFKLESSFRTSSMVLFDDFGVLKKFESTSEIMKIFYDVRLRKYQERRLFLLGMLEAECTRLENQARFILEKIEGEIVIENRARKDVIATLVERGYLSDPVKVWKASVNKEAVLDDDDGDSQESQASSNDTVSGGADFQYLLTMHIMSLSKEKKEELLKQRDEKKVELETLRGRTPQDIWLDELDAFLEELDKVEEQEKKDDKASSGLKVAKVKSAKGRVAKPKIEPVVVKEPKRAVKPKPPTVKPTKVTKSKEAKEMSAPAPESEVVPIKEVVDGEDVDCKEVLSLAERLKIGKKKKQTTLTFSAKQQQKLGSDSDNSDEDFKPDFGPDELAPRASSRSVKQKVKYVLSDGDTSDDESVSVKSDVQMDSDTEESSVLPTEATKRKSHEIESAGNLGSAEEAEAENPSPKKKKANPGKEASQSKPGSTEKPINLEDSPIKGAASNFFGGPKKKEKAVAKKAPVKSNKAIQSASDEDSDVDKPKKKVPTKSRKAPTKTKEVSSDGDSDVDKPKKKVPNKSRKAPAKTKEVSSDSDAEPAKKTLKSNKRRKFGDSDDDDDSFRIDIDEGETIEVQRRPRTERTTVNPKTKYKFSSSEDDDDDDDDSDLC